MSLPTLKFLVRGQEGLSLLVGPSPDGDPESVLDRVACTAALFSPDGSKLAIATSNDVKLWDTASVKEILCLPLSGVRTVAFSPRGSYLQTFQDPSVQPKNINVWDLKTRTAVFQHSQKAMSKSTWPTIQFSEDESVACRLVANGVHIFNGGDISKGVVDRLQVTGLQTYQLSFSPPSHIATYVPEIKGAPAFVKVFSISQLSQDAPVGRRSFYKSTSAQLLWNRGSTGVLIVAQSDVDKSNQSYYGESRLHYITSDGAYEGAVPLKDGPIHDVQWSPSGKEFVVVYGFMPSRSTLFDANCKPLFDFGTGPYNTVRWSLHCQFICLAGFGNLPGDMAFWDRGTLKALGLAKAPCSVTCAWSADGRYLMTATTAPRLQVDNGIKIFKYNGALKFQKSFDKLYQAEWQPAALGTFEDRPASPRRANAEVSKKPAVISTLNGDKKPASYRPPHTIGADALKTQLFGEESKVKGGGAEMSKSALKNKKRREKQKELKGET